MQRKLEKWALEQRSQGKRTKLSLKKILNWITRFVNYMKQNHKITTLQKLTKKVMTKYFTNNFKSQATKEIEYYYLKSFFKWCIENNHLISSPIDKIKITTTTTIKNRALTKQQIATIINQITTEDFYGIQNRCIVELSYATAIRINELIQLNTEDIDLESRRIIIKHGKGNKQRILPLIATAVAWLRKYLAKARAKLIKKEKCPALFIGKAGGRISASYIDRLMKRLREKTKIPGISIHALRHSCATHLLQQELNIVYIQRLLGHQNLATTQRYLSVDNVLLRKQYVKAHPRDKIDIN
ncbi:tyrosine-type recombinase/integrase [Candidatus Uabimicrobium sp. HlEnr_7]|uniref:tyrosine-type recombinase/integrase n=1 Tax=Candidatus Uabimicrobium helgolandensis TaxID=3095367 RepID=UPI0035581D43